MVSIHIIFCQVKIWIDAKDRKQIIVYIHLYFVYMSINTF